MDNLKSSKGRLREACVEKIHELRGAFDAQGNPKRPERTYQEIAAMLNVSIGTVYNVVTGRTHPDMHPAKKSSAG